LREDYFFKQKSNDLAEKIAADNKKINEYLK
jgi:hypothetical protein